MLIEDRGMHYHITWCAIEVPPRMIHMPIYMAMLYVIAGFLVLARVRLKQETPWELVGVPRSGAPKFFDHV
jgi:hypothetical protein